MDTRHLKFGIKSKKRVDWCAYETHTTTGCYMVQHCSSMLYYYVYGTIVNSTTCGTTL